GGAGPGADHLRVRQRLERRRGLRRGGAGDPDEPPRDGGLGRGLPSWWARGGQRSSGQAFGERRGGHGVREDGGAIIMNSDADVGGATAMLLDRDEVEGVLSGSF